MKRFLLPIFNLLLVGCSGIPGTFQGEYIRGNWTEASAMRDCMKTVAALQDYPARCESNGFDSDRGYGEVWLIRTNSKRTKSGNEITKIWTLKSP